MIRQTFQKLFRWISAHSKMGKAISLLRTSPKDKDSEEPITLLYEARREFAELRSNPAYFTATNFLADALSANSSGDGKRNAGQAIAVLEEGLIRKPTPSGEIFTNYTDAQRWRKECTRLELECLRCSAYLIEIMINKVKTLSGEKFGRYIQEVIDFNFTNIINELGADDPQLLEAFAEKIDTFQRGLLARLEILKEGRSVKWMYQHLSLAGLYICRGAFLANESEIGHFQKQAVYHFKQALTILADLKNSFYLSFISRFSGFPILFVSRQWAAAEKLFRFALDAQEETYILSLSEKGKESLLKEVGNPLFGLSAAQAYVLARQGKVVEAVEILEKWRARRLNEDLRRYPRNLSKADAADHKEYQEIVYRIEAFELNQRNHYGNFPKIIAELRSAREQLANVSARIRLPIPNLLFTNGPRWRICTLALAALHLHFSCHGEFGMANTLDSSLMLADGEKLKLRNLLNDRRFDILKDARLVVLSVCWSPLVEISSNPDESTGIAQGFLSAGVPGVIGALWPVDDLSTALIMTEFYRKHICEGLGPATALRAAQHWLREASREELQEVWDEYLDLPQVSIKANLREVYRSDDELAVEGRCPYAHPYYWAGFVLIGV